MRLTKLDTLDKLNIQVITSIVLILGGFIVLASGWRPTYNTSNDFVHHCTWEGSDDKGNLIPCRYEGLRLSQFTSEAEEGSDSYLFDKTHFTHPTLSEDECEDYMWGFQPQLLRDYQVEILNEDTLILYDKGRFVQYLPFRDEDELSLAIVHDNE